MGHSINTHKCQICISIYSKALIPLNVLTKMLEEMMISLSLNKAFPHLGEESKCILIIYHLSTFFFKVSGYAFMQTSSPHMLQQPSSSLASIEISYKIQAFWYAYILYTTQCCSTTRKVIITALYCKQWTYSPGELQYVDFHITCHAIIMYIQSIHKICHFYFESVVVGFDKVCRGTRKETRRIWL